MKWKSKKQKKKYSKIYMGQVCDCLYRLSHHQTKIEQLEQKLLEYEQFMEQWLVNNSCCDTTSYNKNKYKQIYR